MGSKTVPWIWYRASLASGDGAVSGWFTVDVWYTYGKLLDLLLVLWVDIVSIAVGPQPEL